MTRAEEQVALLSGPPFQRLFARIRQRVEADRTAIGTGVVGLNELSADERAAIGGLIGRAVRGSVRIPLGDLDATLRAGPLAVGLYDVLVRLGGPLRDRVAEAEADARAAGALVAAIDAATFGAEEWCSAWRAELERTGRLVRMAREGESALLAVALAIVASLPTSEVPLAVFASRVAGDAKALDATPLERLVLHALACRVGVLRPSRASERRALWERFGVVPDDLASQVLALGLQPVGGDPLASWLRYAADARIPVRLTLHQLSRQPLRFEDVGPVFVCENPAIVRAAADSSTPCFPLVCTEGQPGLACFRLLAALVAGGADFRVRADFDAAGLDIAGRVLAATGGRPWRFDAATYEQHLGVIRARLREGALPASAWDPALAESMAAHRVFVEEEVLADVLVADVGRSIDVEGEGKLRRNRL